MQFFEKLRQCKQNRYFSHVPWSQSYQLATNAPSDFEKSFAWTRQAVHTVEASKTSNALIWTRSLSWSFVWKATAFIAKRKRRKKVRQSRRKSLAVFFLAAYRHNRVGPSSRRDCFVKPRFLFTADSFRGKTSSGLARACQIYEVTALKFDKVVIDKV